MIRRATLDDAAFLLALRNQPSARRWWHSRRVIEMREHVAWLRRALRHGDCFVEPGVGQVSVAWGGVVSVTVLEGARGNGYGTALLEHALRATVRRRYLATIHRRNLASLRLFIGRGFTPTTMTGSWMTLARGPLR